MRRNISKLLIMPMMSSFVLIIFIILAIAVRGEFSQTHDDEIDQLLKKLNKPALKSIKNPDGDIIDCVHLKNHPIYDHPLFKNHTIQLRPSFYLKDWNNESSNTENENIITQLWTKIGKCPKNSIPIRRTRREDILRVGSIEKYMKKYPENISRPNQTDSIGNNIHEYATVRVNGKFHGVQASINVWKPYVQTPEEFSLAQIWFASGPYAEVNTIEFGWQVYEGRYGDDEPRTFIYWTADGYHKAGCYNTDCPGFVTVNQNFALGATINPISTFDGIQYHFPTTIRKDVSTGNYWLILENNVFVGYWPSKLFNHLQNYATQIQMGGEIINYNKNSQHTTTKMGSGHFAEEGYRKAGYFKNPKVSDISDKWSPIQSYVTYTSTKQQNCYSADFGSGLGSKTYFFYGGPGRNPNCK